MSKIILRNSDFSGCSVDGSGFVETELSLTKANDNNGLQVGGGRLSSGLYDLYFAAVPTYTKLRIKGTFVSYSDNNALWGLYTGTPTTTTIGTPNTTGYVKGSSKYGGSVENPLTIAVNETITNSGTSYIFIAIPKGKSVKLYAITSA